MASVLFLPSCNFRCPYCHNHGLVLHPEEYPDFPWAALLTGLKKQRGWIDGVCITGGEPTLHPWLPSLIREIKLSPDLTPDGKPIPIKLDTNGTRPEVLDRLMKEGLVDYVAMDLKALLHADNYSAMAGILLKEEQMEQVRASIAILLRGKIGFEFRTTLVPGFFEEEEVYTLARQVRGVPRYTLQNFSPRHALDQNWRKLSPLDPKQLARMQKRVDEIIGRRVASFSSRVSGPDLQRNVPGGEPRVPG